MQKGTTQTKRQFVNHYRLLVHLHVRRRCSHRQRPTDTQRKTQRCTQCAAVQRNIVECHPIAHRHRRIARKHSSSAKTHTRACMHAQDGESMCARTHARTHACTNAETHARRNARTHARTHPRTHARTHGRKHAQEHAHKRAHAPPAAPMHAFMGVYPVKNVTILMLHLPTVRFESVTSPRSRFKSWRRR